MNCRFTTTQIGTQYRHVCSVCRCVRHSATPAYSKACKGPGSANPPIQPIVPAGASLGKCHICQEQQPITFCSFCGHWLCKVCKKAWAARGLAALKVWLGGKQDGCCGPTPL